MVLILVVLVLAIGFPGPFVTTLNTWSTVLLTRLSPVFAYTALISLIVMTAMYVLPIGRVTIGGEGAKPILSRFSWCTISLCNIASVGILFWAMAEPITHSSQPPASLGLVPNSPEAMRFALSTVYLHWTILPCAMYALPALLFAIAFYNLGLPFSLSSPLSLVLGRKLSGKLASSIDALSLFALVAGMAASLATGILTLSGGLGHLFGWKSAAPLWTGIGVVVLFAFIASALSGLQRGVTYLSNINSIFFLLLGLFMIAYGPFSEMLALSIEGTKEFLTHFTGRALLSDFAANDPWPRSWTVFYWCVWLAWAPVTSAFLGRIAVGYTVRAFIFVNVIFPAAFSLVWMSIFGGSALAFQRAGGDLVGLLQTHGPEALLYAVLAKLPLAAIIIPAFLVKAFISYVVAADSNSMSMAGLSTEGISPEQADPSTGLKLVWGGAVVAFALCLLCLSGVDGIRTLSYLGGIPALFYEIIAAVGLMKLCWRPEKFGLKIPKWKTPSEKSALPVELPQGSLP